MTKGHRFFSHKSVAFFLSLLFSLQSAVAAQPVTASLPDSVNLSASFNHISIPPSLGRIDRQSFNSHDKDKPLVIYIQDAHAIVDAQANIQGLIEHFESRYGVTVVALEGGSGELDARLFKAFPDNFARRKVFSEYLKRGEITGAEIAAVFGKSNAKYFGIEDWGLYQKNYSAYIQNCQKKKQVGEELLAARKLLDQQRTNLYPKEMNQFHLESQAFYEEKNKFEDFMKTLEVYGEKLGKSEMAQKYPELVKLWAGIQTDSQLSEASLSHRIMKMAQGFDRRCAFRLSREKQKIWNEKYQAFRISGISASEYLKFIVEIAREIGVQPKLPPDLLQLLGQSLSLASIKGTELFDEIENLTDDISHSFATEQPVKNLLVQYEALRLLEALNQLELTESNWTKIQQNTEQINILFPQIWKGLNIAREFYQVAQKRDFIFHENLKQILKKEKAKAAIVLTGGFHRQGFESQLAKENYSYVVVTPSIQNLAGQEMYETVMHEKVSYKKYLTDSYYDAFARHASERLVENFDEPNFRNNLKLWRDNIIRELALEGKTAEAANYTKYIDPLFKNYYEKYGLPTARAFDKESAKQLMGSEFNQYREKVVGDLWASFQNQFEIFSDGLKNLASNKKIDQDSILNLIDQSSKVSLSKLGIPLVLAKTSRHWITKNSEPPERTPAINRSEARVEGAGQFENLEAKYVEFPYADSYLDIIFYPGMLFQLRQLNLTPEQFITDAIAEIEPAGELSSLKGRLVSYKRIANDKEPIRLYGPAKDDDVTYLPLNIAKQMLMREFFQEILQETQLEKSVNRNIFNIHRKTRIDYRSYYGAKIGDDELFEALKAITLTQRMIYFDMADRLGLLKLNEKQHEEFIQFFNEHKAEMNVEATDLAYRFLLTGARSSKSGFDYDAASKEWEEVKIKKDQLDGIVAKRGFAQTAEESYATYKEMLAIDPHDKYARIKLLTVEKYIREEEQKRKGIAQAGRDAEKFTNAAAEDVLKELERAIDADQKYYAMALFAVFSKLTAVSLEQSIKALILLPHAYYDYEEANALYGALTQQHRNLVVDSVLEAEKVGTPRFRKILINYYSSSAIERREALLADDAGLKFDGIDRVNEAFEAKKQEMNLSAIKINSDYYNIKNKKEIDGDYQDLHSFLASEKSEGDQLDKVKAYFEIKYGVTLNIPFGEDTPYEERPKGGDGEVATLYSKSELPALMEKLIQLDDWLSVLPPHLMLHSLSLREFLIVKEMRSHYHMNNNVISLSMDRGDVRQTLYHETGHSFQGHPNSFFGYIAPARITEIISKHREDLKETGTEIIQLAQGGQIDEKNRGQVTWDLFQALWKLRFKRWKEFNEKIGVTDLNAPFKRSRTSEKIEGEYGEVGNVSNVLEGKPSLALAYIFEKPYGDAFGNNFVRDNPDELIAEFAQLYILHPKVLRDFDPIGYDIFDAMAGDIHSRSEIRMQETSDESDEVTRERINVKMRDLLLGVYDSPPPRLYRYFLDQLEKAEGLGYKDILESLSALILDKFSVDWSLEERRGVIGELQSIIDDIKNLPTLTPSDRAWIAVLPEAAQWIALPTGEDNTHEEYRSDVFRWIDLVAHDPIALATRFAAYGPHFRRDFSLDADYVDLEAMVKILGTLVPQLEELKLQSRQTYIAVGKMILNGLTFPLPKDYTGNYSDFFETKIFSKIQNQDGSKKALRGLIQQTLEITVGHQSLPNIANEVPDRLGYLGFYNKSFNYINIEMLADFIYRESKSFSYTDVLRGAAGAVEYTDVRSPFDVKPALNELLSYLQIDTSGKSENPVDIGLRSTNRSEEVGNDHLVANARPEVRESANASFTEVIAQGKLSRRQWKSRFWDLWYGTIQKNPLALSVRKFWSSLNPLNDHVRLLVGTPMSAADLQGLPLDITRLIDDSIPENRKDDELYSKVLRTDSEADAEFLKAVIGGGKSAALVGMQYSGLDNVASDIDRKLSRLKGVLAQLGMDYVNASIPGAQISFYFYNIENLQRELRKGKRFLINNKLIPKSDEKDFDRLVNAYYSVEFKNKLTEWLTSSSKRSGLEGIVLGFTANNVGAYLGVTPRKVDAKQVVRQVRLYSPETATVINASRLGFVAHSEEAFLKSKGQFMRGILSFEEACRIKKEAEGVNRKEGKLLTASFSDAEQFKLSDLLEVGSEKAIGYLPVSTIGSKELVQKLQLWAESKKYQSLVAKSASGDFLYIYNEEALRKQISRYQNILDYEGFSTDSVANFVKSLSNHTAYETRAWIVIGRMFNNSESRGDALTALLKEGTIEESLALRGSPPTVQYNWPKEHVGSIYQLAEKGSGILSRIFNSHFLDRDSLSLEVENRLFQNLLFALKGAGITYEKFRTNELSAEQRKKLTSQALPTFFSQTNSPSSRSEVREGALLKSFPTIGTTQDLGINFPDDEGEATKVFADNLKSDRRVVDALLESSLTAEELENLPAKILASVYTLPASLAPGQTEPVGGELYDLAALIGGGKPSVIMGQYVKEASNSIGAASQSEFDLDYSLPADLEQAFRYLNIRYIKNIAKKSNRRIVFFYNPDSLRKTLKQYQEFLIQAGHLSEDHKKILNNFINGENNFEEFEKMVTEWSKFTKQQFDYLLRGILLGYTPEVVAALGDEQSITVSQKIDFIKEENLSVGEKLERYDAQFAFLKLKDCYAVLLPVVKGILSWEEAANIKRSRALVSSTSQSEIETGEINQEKPTMPEIKNSLDKLERLRQETLRTIFKELAEPDGMPLPVDEYVNKIRGMVAAQGIEIVEAEGPSYPEFLKGVLKAVRLSLKAVFSSILNLYFTKDIKGLAQRGSLLIANLVWGFLSISPPHVSLDVDSNQNITYKYMKNLKVFFLPHLLGLFLLFAFSFKGYAMLFPFFLLGEISFLEILKKFYLIVYEPFVVAVVLSAAMYSLMRLAVKLVKAGEAHEFTHFLQYSLLKTIHSRISPDESYLDVKESIPGSIYERSVMPILGTPPDKDRLQIVVGDIFDAYRDYFLIPNQNKLSKTVSRSEIRNEIKEINQIDEDNYLIVFSNPSRAPVIVTKFNQGDFATAYRAFVNDRAIVLKIPHAGSEGPIRNTHAYRGLKKEERVSNLLNPLDGISKTIGGADLKNGNYGLVIEGPIAESFEIWKDRLSVKQRALVMSFYAKKIYEAWTKGVGIHDLQPGNVLLKKEGGDISGIEVIDLGAAKVVGDDPKEDIWMLDRRYRIPEKTLVVLESMVSEGSLTRSNFLGLISVLELLTTSYDFLIGDRTISLQDSAIQEFIHRYRPELRPRVTELIQRLKNLEVYRFLELSEKRQSFIRLVSQTKVDQSFEEIISIFEELSTLPTKENKDVKKTKRIPTAFKQKMSFDDLVSAVRSHAASFPNTPFPEDDFVQIMNFPIRDLALQRLGEGKEPDLEVAVRDVRGLYGLLNQLNPTRGIDEVVSFELSKLEKALARSEIREENNRGSKKRLYTGRSLWGVGEARRKTAFEFAAALKADNSVEAVLNHFYQQKEQEKNQLDEQLNTFFQEIEKQILSFASLAELAKWLESEDFQNQLNGLPLEVQVLKQDFENKIQSLAFRISVLGVEFDETNSRAISSIQVEEKLSEALNQFNSPDVLSSQIDSAINQVSKSEAYKALIEKLAISQNQKASTEQTVLLQTDSPLVLDLSIFDLGSNEISQLLELLQNYFPKIAVIYPDYMTIRKGVVPIQMSPKRYSGQLFSLTSLGPSYQEAMVAMQAAVSFKSGSNFKGLYIPIQAALKTLFNKNPLLLVPVLRQIQDNPDFKAILAPENLQLFNQWQDMLAEQLIKVSA